MNYWKECVEIALEEAGVKATQEQISQITEAVEGGHENYAMAFGHDVASVNFRASQEREKDQLRKDLERERSKVTCRECGGRGRIITLGPYHSSDSECWKCRGEGRHDP